MRFTRRNTVTLLFFVGTVFPAVQGFCAEKSLAEKLDKLVVASGLKKGDLGLSVAVLRSEKSGAVYQLNADQQRLPASLTKIATAYAVLKRLPGDFKVSTQLLTSAPSEKGEIKGDLILKGHGDPAFVSEHLWVLVGKLHRSGVRKVLGDIVVDDTYFDQQRFDPSRTQTREDRAYDAPVGAMSFNWNSVTIYASPAANAGDPMDVQAEPMSDYVQLTNRTQTRRRGQSKNLSTSRSDRSDDQVGDQFIIKGGIAVGEDEKRLYRSVRYPGLWSGYNLKAFLEDQDIMVTGRVRKAQAPSSARVLVEQESKPLREMVADLMKFSNNFVAEMLTKHLSIVAGETPGNLSSGMQSIVSELVKAGIPKDRFQLINPSGLTRRNKMAPSDLRKVLEEAYRDFRISSEFVSSLPVAGTDGTLERRMPQVKGWVRAKTGLLSGVAGLAGYAGRPNGEIHVFSFIFNGSNKQRWSAMELFDRLAAQLADEE